MTMVMMDVVDRMFVEVVVVVVVVVVGAGIDLRY
jgi:hypothetical protein